MSDLTRIEIKDIDGDELRCTGWSDGNFTLSVTDKNEEPEQSGVVLLTPKQAKKLRKFLRDKKS